MLSHQYSILDIKQIINAQTGALMESSISTMLTDSRRIIHPAEALFFALSGRRDGHEFIYALYESGVRNFVVTHVPERIFIDANFLIVNDVLAALQKLAAYHRSRFDLKVIGITGSNGKTIVKEWLYQLISPDKNIVRNPKSYNSQIGVPLAVWQINEANELGIFEAGISTVNEMDKLEAIIQPTIGVFTHLGPAHNEGFADIKEKVHEKLRLFKNCHSVVYQYETLQPFWDMLKVPHQFTWSRKFNHADLYIAAEQHLSGHVYIKAVYQNADFEFRIPFGDEASVENAITCLATLLALGYGTNEAAKRIERLNAVSMRLELKNGINDCSIIDDSYNSDVQSLEIALNFLNQQNQHPVKTLILSDIYQSGLTTAVLYQQVSDLISSKKVDKFIGVGKALADHQCLFNLPTQYFFKDTDELLLHLKKLNFQHETILLKGSRSFEFERVSRELVQKAHETVMEINLNALLNNLNFYRSKIEPGVKIMAMVKAFSYGSGTFEVANILQYHQVDYLAVAYIDEGVALRKAGIELPIMVLNPEASAFDKLVEFHLEPELYSFGILNDFIRFAAETYIAAYPVHLKIDTGMHRLGFEIPDLEELCTILQSVNYIKVQSVFSHMVASDNTQHDDFTLKQIGLFEQAVNKIEKAIGYSTIKHICNTSAVTRWPQAHYNMVRLGIGLYGVDAAVGDHSLQPIATLKTSVSQVKHIHAGDTIGYNRNGRLNNDGKIATVRIGYADGYLRAFGNGIGKMLVNGKLVPTVGNIAMDMCMLDVTGVEVNEGDEVVIFNDRYGIEELATQIGTIPYEILTNVSQRVKRVYFYE